MTWSSNAFDGKNGTYQYVVVTRVVRAKSGTVIQSNAKNASIVLEAKSGAMAIDEALEVAGAVRIGDQESISVQVVAEGNITPLIGLGRIDYGKFDFLHRSPRFNVFGVPISSSALASIVKSTPEIEYADVGRRGSHVALNVHLRDHGDYVNAASLVKLAEPVLAGGIVVGSTSLDRATLTSIVERSPDIDLVTHGTAGQRRRTALLRLRLPKRGQRVEMTSLAALVEPMLSDTPAPETHQAIAALEFREIP